MLKKSPKKDITMCSVVPTPAEIINSSRNGKKQIILFIIEITYCSTKRSIFNTILK